MADYIITNGQLHSTDELMHYGVKGMKWGVRKDEKAKAYRSDRRTTKKLKRHLAADKKNLITKGRIHDADADEYEEAEYNYKKTVSKPAFNQKAKRERIREASENLTRAGSKAAKTLSDLNRAERIYDEDAKTLRTHIDKMINDYGSENVKALKTRDMSLGRHYTKNVIKTGITLADLPVLGTLYTGNYVSKREQADREERLNEAANKRY